VANRPRLRHGLRTVPRGRPKVSPPPARGDLRSTAVARSGDRVTTWGCLSRIAVATGGSPVATPAHGQQASRLSPPGQRLFATGTRPDLQGRLGRDGCPDKRQPYPEATGSYGKHLSLSEPVVHPCLSPGGGQGHRGADLPALWHRPAIPLCLDAAARQA